MIAPAIAGGQVDLIGGRKELLGEFWQSLQSSGLEISETADGIRAKRVNEIIKAVDVKTEVYPGFATDLLGLLIIFPPTRKFFLKNVSKNYSEKVKEKQDFIDGESEDIESDNDRKL